VARACATVGRRSEAISHTVRQLSAITKTLCLRLLLFILLNQNTPLYDEKRSPTQFFITFVQSMKKQTLVLASFIGLLLITVIVSCKKKEKTNDALYAESIAGDLKFYQNKDTLYSPAGNSPHGDFKLKFNAIALANLGADGKLPKGVAFSYGALIVKEIYSGGKISLYAIMKKEQKSKYAKNEWVWAEYGPDGETVYNVGLKGKGCVSCHNAGATRDYTRTFDLH